MPARRSVRSAGGAAFIAVVVSCVCASSALAAPSIVNTGTYTSGNASFQETGAIEQDSGGNRRVDATFVVNHDPGRTISQVVGDGISASFSQETAGANTRVIHATFNVTNFPSMSCGVLSGTRRNNRSIGWRVVDNTGVSSATVTQNLKFIEDEQCSGATDFPVLEASGHGSNGNIAPGGSFPFSFTCDDADGSGDGDRCDFIIARWRRLSDGATQSEGNFDAEDNTARSYTASAPTTRGVWVLEAQLSTENGVDDNDWWRLGRVRVNPSGFSAGTIAFTGASPSSPPSVNQGTTVTAEVSGYASDAQLINWSGTTSNGLAFNGNPFLSGGNLVNPALAAAQTERSVSTATHGTKSVSATLTDNGAIDAADGARDTANASASLYVNAIPTATGQSVTVVEDVAHAITLSGNDPDDQPLTPLSFSVATAPTKGTVSIVGSTATYTPNADATGADSFTFTAADGPASGNRAFAVSAPATVTIGITPVNDAPVAQDFAFTTSEDTPKDFELQGSDVDSATLTYTITDQPDHGAVTCAGKDCTYTPAANFHGEDELEYQVSDGSLSDTAKVSITVTEGNDVPTATDQFVTTAEDTAAEIELEVEDADGDALTVSTVTGPDHGTVTYAGTTATYTPAANFHGDDAFTYEASDGKGGTVTATVSIEVTPVNDAPTAQSATLSTNEDTPLPLQLTGADADGDDLTFALEHGPQHGSVMCDGSGACTYTPATNFHGSDSFTYRANDGSASSAIATVDIDVHSVNDGPVGQDATATTDEDTAVDVEIQAADVDDDSLTYGPGATGPVHGSLAFDGATVTYTPAPNFHGQDQFTVLISDGQLTDEVTVSVEVVAVNDAPTADGLMVSTDEDTPVDVQVAGADVDGDDLTFEVADEPQDGSVSCDDDGACTYSPVANFHGTDSFTYRASDGTASSAKATVEILVNPVNDAPVGEDASATTDEDTPVDVGLEATDVDDTTLTFGPGSTSPSKGSIAFDGSTMTYTPNANANGSDEFTVVVSDGELSDEMTVSITIRPVNDAPVADGQMVFVDEDGVLLISLTGSDVDGDAISFQAPVTGPAHGQIECNTSGACAYAPAHDYFGPDSFTFRVSDGTLQSSPATVDIVVRAVNDAPDVRDETVATNEDEAIDVELDVSDVDGDEVTLSIGQQPQHGTVTLAGTTATYTPAPNFHGQDQFTVVGSDGELSDEGTVKVTVRSINDAPTADSLMVSTDEDAPLGVQLEGDDLDGDDLTFEVDDAPQHGAVDCDDDGDCTYTPPANFHGTDSFTYRASDGTAQSAEATVDIVVNPVNDAPVGQDASATTDEDTPVDVEIEATDVDDTELTYGPGSTQPSKGSIAFDGSTVTYTPNANATGDDEFTVVISDGELTDEVTVTITIASVNDAPVAQDAELTTDEDTPADVTVQATDLDGDDLSFSVTSGPSHGTLTCEHDAVCTYTPADNYHGGDQATVTVTDGNGGSDAATVSITVRPVNDTPTADDQAVETAEDTGVEIELDVADVDGDTLSASATDGPDHGSVTFDGTSATYTPAANFHGDDAFTYEVSDGHGGVASATVSITVTPVNDAPTLEDVTATTAEDTSKSIAIPAQDADGDALLLTATTPEHGSVTCSDGSCLYTPAANYHGIDTFDVTATDPSGASATAAVTVTVTPVNDPPVAQDLDLGTNEDTQLDFSLQASDVDGDPLSYTTTQPAHGTVSCLAQSCHYQPAPDYNGPDQFTYTVTDGAGGSDTAVVRIEIGEVSYPTRITAEPMVFITQRQNGTLLGALGVQVRLLKVRAQLTRSDTGAPQAGETLVFRSGSAELCRATTGADGWAMCTAPVLSFPATLLSGGYTAYFAGDPDLHASQGSAPTIGL